MGGGGPPPRYDENPLAAPTRAVERSAPPPLQAIVGTAPAGRPLPAGFLGLSFEYGALEAYAGGNPAALNPVFVRLLRNLTPAARAADRRRQHRRDLVAGPPGRPSRRCQLRANAEVGRGCQSARRGGTRAR